MTHSTNSTLCFHCGDHLPRKIVPFDNQSFCCTGCATVYELLSASGMDNYYQLQDRPGIKGDNADNGRYAFLDLPEIQDRLIQFREGRHARITLKLPAIHCSSCIWLLENLYKIHPGVNSVAVFFTRKEATILYNPEEISLRHLVELLVKLGYSPEINFSTFGEKERALPKQLYYKIGIAGFCFGNIMLLSLPEYLGMGAGWEAYAHFFGWINIFLSIPVFTYASSGYYKSAWAALQHKQVNIDVPITIGIFALFGRSVYEIVSGAGAGYMDSLAGLLFFLLVGKWFQEKTYQSLAFDRKYDAYFPVAATVVKGQVEKQIPLKELRPGMEIIVRNQELIPADAELLSDEASIDFSFVTGESDLVYKQKGSFIYAGGRQSGTAIRLKVRHAVDQSYLTALWNQQVFKKPEQAPVQLFIDRVSRRFTIIVLLIAAIGAIFWWMYDPSRIAQVVTAVLIVACPCALALSAPFTMGLALRVMGRNLFYLRNVDSIEKMASVTDIVVDKTGTLTHTDQYVVTFEGPELSPENHQRVALLAGQSNHPLSRTIADFLKLAAQEDVMDFEEIPGSGLKGTIGSTPFILGSERMVTGDSANTDGSTRVYLKIGEQVMGYFRLRSAYRQNIDRTLQELNRNYRLHLLSGDHDGEQKRLSKLIPTDRMHFRQSPYDKLKYIEGLRNKGRVVLMLGDGLNDAGALKAANMGVSVADNVYAFTPACDAIVDGSVLNRLPGLLQLSRSGMDILRWSIVLSFMYNTIGLSFALSGMLSPLVAAILMPLSSISVVVFTTGMVNWKTRKLKQLY